MGSAFLTRGFVRFWQGLLSPTPKGNRQVDVPPVPTWTCPDCGLVHRPADLLRLDANRLQCKACQEPFDAVSDLMRERNM